VADAVGGATSFFAGLIGKGAAADALTQGIGVATGLQ